MLRFVVHCFFNTPWPRPGYLGNQNRIVRCAKYRVINFEPNDSRQGRQGGPLPWPRPGLARTTYKALPLHNCNSRCFFAVRRTRAGSSTPILPQKDGYINNPLLGGCPRMLFCPNSLKKKKKLSSEYQLYACGNFFEHSSILNKIAILGQPPRGNPKPSLHRLCLYSLLIVHLALSAVLCFST